MMPKEQGRKLVAQNRKARHDYYIDDVFEAGLVLTGTEVKSLRAGHANLVDGYAHIRDGEAWLAGVHIPEYTEGTWTNHEPRRERKLLLHRAEILRLIGKTKEGGITLVPVALYFVYSMRFQPGLRVFKHILRGYGYMSAVLLAEAIQSFRRALDTMSVSSRTASPRNRSSA